jgi:hypothetical protein
VGEGFEPSKAEPTGLQPVPFDRSGIPPGGRKFSDDSLSTGRGGVDRLPVTQLIDTSRPANGG